MSHHSLGLPAQMLLRAAGFATGRLAALAVALLGVGPAGAVLSLPRYLAMALAGRSSGCHEVMAARCPLWLWGCHRRCCQPRTSRPRAAPVPAATAPRRPHSTWSSQCRCAARTGQPAAPARTGTGTASPDVSDSRARDELSSCGASSEGASSCSSTRASAAIGTRTLSEYNARRVNDPSLA